jgi:hypothetical protein
MEENKQLYGVNSAMQKEYKMLCWGLQRTIGEQKKGRNSQRNSLCSD